MDAGQAGGVVGILGGVVGTYFTVRNASRPRERALMVRLAAVGWLWLAAMLCGHLLFPQPFRQAVLLLHLPLLVLIPRWNRNLARARTDDKAGADGGGTISGRTD